MAAVEYPEIDTQLIRITRLRDEAAITDDPLHPMHKAEVLQLAQGTADGSLAARRIFGNPCMTRVTLPVPAQAAQQCLRNLVEQRG